jgi:flagellar biosynthesis GTPase FlhF
MYLISLMHGHVLFKNNAHCRFLLVNIFGKSFLRNLHLAEIEVLHDTGRSINICIVFSAASAIGPHV